MKTKAIIIDELIEYGKIHLELSSLDAVYVKNRLMHLLNVDIPNQEECDLSFVKDLKVPDQILDELREILKAEGQENIELLITEIMGELTPMPQYVADKVLSLEKEKHGKGLDYLFNLSIKNNYIQKTAIDKNIYWRKDYPDNFIEITINLSKPEKKNTDIAKLLNKPVGIKYPACLLCLENLGYAGRSDHPARENIRVVPLKLNGEDWFLQYSPYAYFDHHAIIINKEHHNMSINDTTFIKLLDFVDNFPTFFVGSNADLPIVGGSILNHEHYQGGLHLLPVYYSKDKKVYYQDKEVKVSLINWFNTVIRIEGTNKERISEIGKIIFHAWDNYDDPENDIISHVDGKRHSTVTPVARKVDEKTYQLNLILRNNRCNEEYPDGIFHAHKEYHNIKSEGIGLIEAMGLFILPPRLKRQTGYIEEILTSDKDINEFYKAYPDLEIHREMINKLVKENGRKLTSEKAHEVVKEYINETCRNILINTAVYKDTPKGNAGLNKFIATISNKF